MKILYWIDDSHDNQRLPKGAAKRRLEEGLGIKLRPDKPINDRAEFLDILANINPTTTRGVIMDYQLTGVEEHGQEARGTIWAAEVRARYPSVPVIGISHCEEKDIPQFQLENFLAFFPRTNLTDANPEIENLRALLEGHSFAFSAYEARRGMLGVEIMLNLLAPPKGSEILVASAIPESLRGKWDKETPHVAGRWIWHELQGRPGLLFDELGLATYLGLNTAGLELVRSKFDRALYRGAFASNKKQRWWVSMLRGLCEKTLGRTIVGPVGYAREDLLKAVKIRKSKHQDFFARPFGKKSYAEIPDCVAYRDDQREEDGRIQALLSDTEVDEQDANPPFGFEARRIFVTGKRA